MFSRTRTLSLLLATAIFLAPLNLFFKWGESQAYVGGIFSDYLVGKVWLAEIPVLLMLCVWLTGKIRSNFKKIPPFLKKNKWLLLVGLALLARQFFSPLPTISLLYFSKLTTFILFGLCLKEMLPALNKKLIHWSILITFLFQCTIAVLQFAHQQPLFEYSVLGETQFTGAINIARAQFKNSEVILPYGTTAHPNILAGVVTLLAIMWLRARAQENKTGWRELTIIALTSVVLFLTQSYTAIAAFVIFLLFEMFQFMRTNAKLFAMLFILIAPLSLLLLPTDALEESLSRRLFLNGAAATALINQPLAGVGLGMFTSNLQASRHTFTELIRFVQPAHNVFLLWLAEAGLIGVLFIAALARKFFRPNDWGWLLILAPILSFDHYLITQWAGAFFVVFIMNTWGKKEKS